MLWTYSDGSHIDGRVSLVHSFVRSPVRVVHRRSTYMDFVIFCNIGLLNDLDKIIYVRIALTLIQRV